MQHQRFENQRELEWFYCLCIQQIPRIGLVKAKQLVEEHKTAERAWAFIWEIESHSGNLFSAEHRTQFEALAYETVSYEKMGGQRFVLYSDTDYPASLWICPDAPLVLYVRGTLPKWTGVSLSIVGTRHCTPYGKAVLQELIAELAPLRPLIVSGAAAGIDGEAHRLSLMHNLPTIAVLGHGLNKMYPAAHRQLAQEIVAQNGALVTEFKRSMHASKSTFLQRNRIVAAWTSATIVIESDLPGGSLATARLALEYGREVLVIPGRIFDEKSKGCLDLLVRDRAKLIRNSADIQHIMGWQSTAVSSNSAAIQLPLHLKALLEVIEKGKATQWNEWFVSSGLSLADFSSLLLELELLDYVKALPGNWYMRKV